MALAAGALPAAAQHEHHGVPSPTRLDTLTVRGARDPFVIRSGLTIMEPRASTAAAGTVADLLRTVPGLEMDAQGNLTLRGNANVLVLIDGRRTPLTGEALASFLRQLPATALERVEAGTVPDARKDANGAAGVVNLVMRSVDDAEHRVGLRSASASIASADDFMAHTAATGHLGRMMHWDAMYSLSAQRPTTYTRTSTWAEVPGDLPLTTEEERRARERHRLHSVLAGLSVTPTARTTLALRGSYSWMRGAYDERRSAEFTDEAGNTASALTGSWIEHEMPTAELIGLARVRGDGVSFESELRTNGVREAHRGAYDDLGAGFRYRSATMDVRQREHVLRNDLSFRALLPAWELAVGHESRLRDVDVGHDALHYTARVVQQFRQELSVHAGYLSASRTLGAWGTNAGVRVEGERTLVGVDSLPDRAGTAVRVFPTLAASWTDAGRGVVYRLGYGRRTTRPDAGMLNPYTMGEGEDEEVVGSPALRPETIDQVEVGVERHEGWGVVQVTPFVRWMRDPLRVMREPDARGQVTAGMRNLEWARALGADVGFRAHANEWAEVTVAGNLARLESAGAGVRNVGTYASARLLVDLRVAARTTAQLLVARRDGEVIEQGDGRAAVMGELALRQRIAGGRGVVSLRVSDPFRGDLVGYRMADAGFSEAQRGWTRRPVLALLTSFAVGGKAR